MPQTKKHILILGGGYGALSFLANLHSSCFFLADFTLITNSTHHYPTVRLHEIVSHNAEIEHDYAEILPPSVRYIHDEVLRIMPNIVQTQKSKYSYDVLIVALGFMSDDFGILGIRQYAYSMINATNCRALHELLCNRLASIDELSHAYERQSSQALAPTPTMQPLASINSTQATQALESTSNIKTKLALEPSPPIASTSTTSPINAPSISPSSSHIFRIIVCGGGLSGIELIASLAEDIPALCARMGITHEIELVCIEAMEQILPIFPKALAQKALEYLEAHNVRVKTKCKILEVLKQGVRVEYEGAEHIITSHMTIWSAGVKGSDVIKESALFTSVRNRIEVDSYLMPLHGDFTKSIFVLGDCAMIKDANGRFSPPTAQQAVQQGAYLARVFPAFLHSGNITHKFKFIARGTICALGSRYAIGVIWGVGIYGRWVMYIKRFIELLWIIKLKGIKNALKRSTTHKHKT